MNYFIFLYLLLGLVIFFAACYLFWAGASIIGLVLTRGVPFVPLNKKQLSGARARLSFVKDKAVVDLGCGDGRVLRLFEKMGAATAHGYELNVWACLRAWISNWFGRSRTRVYLADFRNVDLREADVIFCYLLEGNLRRLRSLFETKLKPGAVLISYAFKIPDWREPNEIIATRADLPERDRIFVYKINN